MFLQSLRLLLLCFLGRAMSARDCNQTQSFPVEAIEACDPIFARVLMSYKITVFGIPLYASQATPVSPVKHAANVLAQYLDNDEDGIVDDAIVLDKIKQTQSCMVMFKDEDDISAIGRQVPPYLQYFQGTLQDLLADEVVFVNGDQGHFDASLEEVLHLVSSTGWANAYPDVFGESGNTTLTRAMDVARGGHFTTIPDPYPAGAWYTYDDDTCDYECMAIEYFYWLLTSILGAQDFPGRLVQIQDEWRLNTRPLVQAGDPAGYALATSPLHNLPIHLPDGCYMRI